MNAIFKSLIAAATLATASFAAPPAATPAPTINGGRHQQQLANAQKGPYDLVFIGDSITHFWEKAPHQEVQKKHFGDAAILNLGISGEHTHHALWRLEKMPWETIRPKAFMIMIGTNNTGHSNRDSAEDIAEGIGEIVKLLREKTPEAKIMLLAIFPRADLPNNPHRIKNSTVNALIGKFADNKNIFYWDIGSKFMKEDGTTLDRATMPDALHPNTPGYELWATAVAPTLLKWAGKEAP